MRVFSFKPVHFAAAMLALSAGVAQAHTGHITVGVVEGLVHPFGADHLLAMVAVGIWSVSALSDGKAWWGPVVFMLSLVLGAALGAGGLRVPFLEHMIALSVVLFGAMLVLSRNKIPIGLGLGMVALAASLHGLAHGAETPATGFATYAAGFLITTAALHVLGMSAALGISRIWTKKFALAMSGLGASFGVAGVYLLGQL